MRITICFLLVAGLSFFNPLAAQGIQRTWHINGFYSEASTGQGLSSPTPLSGTVRITSTSLFFSTNSGSWTDSEVNFVRSGDTYVHTLEFDRTGDIANGDDQRFVIRLIDEDTAILSYALGQPVGTPDFDNNGNDGDDSVEVIAAVLTAEALPAPVSAGWAGDYEGSYAEVKEKTNGGGFTYGLGSGNLSVTGNKAENQFQLLYGPESSNLTLNGNSLSSTVIKSNPYLMYDDSYVEDGIFHPACYETWEIAYRDDWRLIQLGDGRLVALLFYFSQQEARFVGDEETCGEGADLYNGNRFTGEFEVVAHLLSPSAIGEVSDLGGDVWVERKGAIVTLSLGDPLFEGDVVETRSSSFVKLTLDDQSVITISPDSKLDLAQFNANFDAEPKTIINLLNGFIRANYSGDCGLAAEPCVIYHAGSAAIGVRGTEFTIEFSESGGIEKTTVDVDSGIVETVNTVTGEVVMVEAGQNRTMDVQASLGGSGGVEKISLGLMPDQTVSLNIKTEPLTNYQVEFSEDLVSWDDLGSSFTGSGFIHVFSETIDPNGKKFFRVAETPEVVGENLVILEARYGTDETFNDVGNEVSANIADDILELKIDSFTLGGDPVPGSVKTLYVRYQNSLGEFETEISEGATLRIPDVTHAEL